MNLLQKNLLYIITTERRKQNWKLTRIAFSFQSKIKESESKILETDRYISAYITQQKSTIKRALN